MTTSANSNVTWLAHPLIVTQTQSCVCSCQVPNDEELLFPQGQTYDMIYETYFIPWWKKTYPEDEIASKSR